MTLNGSYTWELKVPVPFIARKAYAHEPAMPAYLLEEPYDEEGPDGNNYNPNATQPVRRFQWWGWLSTIGGYISGNGYVWQFVDPVWQQHLNTHAAMDMSRLNSFIQSVEWWKLIPSGLDGMKTLITDASNVDTSADYVSAAAAKNGTLLVAYIPPAHRGNVTVDMSVLQHNISAKWFDPTDGTYKAVSDSLLNNKGEHSFTPPEKNSAAETDWVLVLTGNKK
ncbi:MAG: putative collagen-binding domain-containing protein, partial [Ferruginibacter sp.]